MSNPAHIGRAVGECVGVVGFFDDPHELTEATKKVKNANYQNFDTFKPYPVHGLEAAQGLKRSPIPYVTFIAGLTGCTCGFLLQYWTSAVDWPLIVGGKPFNSWPAFVPIMFECTILFAGISTLLAMLFFNRLPNMGRKIVDPSLTRDRFAIVIEAPQKKQKSHGAEDCDDEDEDDCKEKGHFKPFEEAEALAFLRQVGAKEVRSVHAEGWF